MNPNKSSSLPPTSNGERYLHLPTGLVLKRPNPPTPEMVERAQPYRADTLQELEAVIRIPTKAIDV